MNDDSRTTGWWARNGALLLPLLLVNAAAIYGQVGWAYEHLLIDGQRVWAVAILFALALESVGFYLAAEAHSAAVANQSSSRLRWASYAVALLVGALNYAHFADPGLRPNAVALAFGGLSVISPWLWAIRSRSLSRTQLLAAGLLDARAVKFTAAQWVLYPKRTFSAFRSAVWVGETDPARARRLIDQPPAPAPVQVAVPVVAANAARPARIAPVRRPQRLGRLAGHPSPYKRSKAPTAPVLAAVPAGTAALNGQTRPPATTIQIPPAPVSSTQAAAAKPPAKPRRKGVGKRSNSDELMDRAIRFYESERQAGRTPSAADVAKHIGKSRATGGRILKQLSEVPS